MVPVTSLVRLVISAVALWVGGYASASAENTADKFYQAYYLERAKADFAGAAKLYGEVAVTQDAGAELQAAGKLRLAVCREELAAGDLARLMPPGPLAYLEINRPGERIRKLLDQMGLLAHGDQPPAPGQNRLAISPALVDALLGMRGAAVAITGFDPANQRPSGVAVFHAGDMEMVRGLIETALPAATHIVQPIGGYATYEIEGAYVTVTARLVVAGSGPEQIEGVLERMKNASAESLASDPQLADVLKDRHGELLFFCLNPKPLLPLMNVALAAAASQSREAVLAQALLDPKSLHAITGRLDVSDEGVVLELALRLDEGHRNLVYNFLRRPAIDRQALRSVPAGAAALIALSMNQAPEKYTDATAGKPGEAPVVTALDIGRELFANINGIAVCALPAAGGSAGGIPDLAAVITVNDPAKSQALWSQLLGIASLAAGAPTMDGSGREIGGTQVHAYQFPAKVTVHTATLGHNLFIASTESALTRSLDTQRSGKSILDDPGFASLISRIGPSTTLALLAHAGRCAELARPFVPAGEAAKLEPVIGLLANTSVAVTVDHSDRLLRLTAAATGVPNVSGLVNKMLIEEQQRQQGQRDVGRAIQQKQWGPALSAIDRQLAERPDNPAALQQKFDLLTVHQRDRAGALAVADALYEAMRDNPESLNNLAWGLLTEKKYDRQFDELALRLARRSNELTDLSQWMYVDTLALAEFEAGNVGKAVELEQKAIDLSKRNANGAGMAELERALRRFKSAPEASGAASKR